MEAAHSETRRLLRQRAAIDTRLAMLKKSIDALARLLENKAEIGGKAQPNVPTLPKLEADDGITTAIRKLLKAHGGPLSPLQVRSLLNEAGFDINSYASGLIVIHSTLKRLERQGEVTLVKTSDGLTAYPVPEEGE